MSTWKPIPGWEQFYEVSDDGQVRSLGYWQPTGKGGRRFLRSGPVATWVHSSGYVCVSLCRQKRRRSAGVHQLVCEAFIGPRPEGMEVRHLDGNPQNNRLSNLAYGTPSENAADTIRHGNHPKLNVTHCPQDHEYTPENTLLRRNGHRVCRECNKRRVAAWYERKKAGRTTPQQQVA